jgi:erythromycin esterase-like protein
MNDSATVSGLAALSAMARDIAGEGLDPMVARAGQADFVLLGEATHGTREFYELRAAITRRLVFEHGFTVIALEADWPDALRLHHYISGAAGDPDAIAALGDFERFPRWMWRNETMPPFLDALREWNRPLAEGQVGIFGMDLYSLHASIHAVLAYLRKTDRTAERRARERYGCFDHFGHDPQQYGYFTERAGVADCEEEVIAQLAEMRRRYTKHRELADDDHFFALQHARVVADAESYYRAMYRGRDESWNLRDAHMTDIITELSRHFHHGGQAAKVVVWAHNSHLGDARATEMGRRGEWNLGQLLRETAAGKAYSIGFSTFAGTVTAAHDWDGPARRMAVRPALDGSYEEIFHRLGRRSFWLDLGAQDEGVAFLRQPRLQRAIGVIYRPQTERMSHYCECTLPDQFDAMIHIDRTHALRALDEGAGPALDLPEMDPAARL